MPLRAAHFTSILLALIVWLSSSAPVAFADPSRAWRHGILLGFGAGAGPGDTNVPDFGRRGVTGFVVDVRAGYGIKAIAAGPEVALGYGRVHHATMYFAGVTLGMRVYF